MGAQPTTLLTRAITNKLPRIAHALVSKRERRPGWPRLNQRA
jgi:hypothetical protein